MYASNLELFLHSSSFGSVSAQVSEDVLAYSALVEEYAQKYGISHFVDVIYCDDGGKRRACAGCDAGKRVSV